MPATIHPVTDTISGPQPVNCGPLGFPPEDLSLDQAETVEQLQVEVERARSLEKTLSRVDRHSVDHRRAERELQIGTERLEALAKEAA